MTASLTLVLLMAVLFGSGVAVMLERSLTRVLIGFLLVGNGVNLLIYLMSGTPGLAPILGEGVDESAISDPLPQAFILTAIVINLGIMLWVFLLAALSWVFYLALRQVFAKRDVCRGNWPLSCGHALLYTVLYTGWLFALVLIAERLFGPHLRGG